MESKSPVSPTQQQDQQRHTVACIEDRVLSVVRELAAVAKVMTTHGIDEAALGCAGSDDVPMPGLFLSDPVHTVMAEDGRFLASTDREQRLTFVPLHYRRIARLFCALDAVHRLNKAGRKTTLRELFYRAVGEAPLLFSDQSKMNNAVRDAVGTLRVGRPHLGVLTTEKGLVAGAISFREPHTLKVQHASGCGMAITEAMLHGDDDCIELGAAHCVLVLEKDSFFQHLLQGRLLASLPLVLVTGRGYPDFLTRRFLQRLARMAPRLPQVYLGDYDPHGISIFLVYRTSCPSLRWLGMHAVDVCNLPEETALPFTKSDLALKASLLEHPQILAHEEFAEQIHAMHCKFELEALHATHGADAIARHFLPEKILRHSWI